VTNSQNVQIEEGKPSPLGASKSKTGLNFALFSRHAEQVTLLLFKPREDDPFFTFTLDPRAHRTGWIWHVLIKNLPSGNIEYSYRIDGSNQDPKNHFDARELLSDPYARSLGTVCQWSAPHEKQMARFARGRVITDAPFDWDNDRSPDIAPEELIIYEMHVRSFTQHSSSRVRHPGTFLGLIEKIPYLKSLGINAVELMPLFEFDECSNPHQNPQTKEMLKNLWGYATINFFAPMNRYASSDGWTAALDEFRMLVKEFHKNGIKVILDVVYNHTGEGEIDFPTFSFRGIDNQVYYLTDASGKYLNFTGTGNTFNANHPLVTRLILDSLRYWVEEMHVDGFRFDLASCLTRDEIGEPVTIPPLIHQITHDAVLKDCLLIAEAWDAAGLYQVGTFPGEGQWSEWNGKYRDEVRRFIKGTDAQAGTFASAMCGSQNVFGNNLKPYQGINFVTAHDGYTLRDLVSYQQKHNMENGEGNRDGSDQNDSWNCGCEGPSSDPHILALRERQMRNLHVALLLSLGTPMIVMGDEYGRTRHGNNNAYCQDNALNWFLWDELEKNKDFARFHRLVIQFRKEHKVFASKNYLTPSDVEWHSQKPLHPDWSAQSRFVAYTLKKASLYIAFNAYFHPADVQLPTPPKGKTWHRIIDTSLSPPHDFEETPQPLSLAYQMPAYSSFVAIC
jgi:isoamylase